MDSHSHISFSSQEKKKYSFLEKTETGFGLRKKNASDKTNIEKESLWVKKKGITKDVIAQWSVISLKASSS